MRGGGQPPGLNWRRRFPDARSSALMAALLALGEVVAGVARSLTDRTGPGYRYLTALASDLPGSVAVMGSGYAALRSPMGRRLRVASWTAGGS